MPSRSCSEASRLHLIGGARLRSSIPDRGSVTAEMAVVLPVLMLVLALALGVLGHAITVVRSTDAARAAARAAARGEPDDVVLELAKRELPSNASVHVAHVGSDVTVTVVVPGPRVALGVQLPDVRAVAVSVVEGESVDLSGADGDLTGGATWR